MYYFIVNPISGKNKAIKNMKKIAEYLTKNGVAFCVYSTTKNGKAGKISAELERFGADNIIAVGGDGTLSEIVNGLSNPSAINLGLIPSGVCNDFARCLGISSNPIKAMKAIQRNKIKKVDYLQGEGYRGINIVGCGVDVEMISKLKNSNYHNKLAYAWCFVKTLLKTKFRSYKIFVDGEILSNTEFMLVACCNGNNFGAGLKLSPNSKINDGKMNLILIKKMTKGKMLLSLLKFLKGKHLQTNFAVEVVCKNVRIEGAETVNVDGEIVNNVPMELSVRKGGLNFFVN